MSTELIKHVTDNSFEADVIQSSTPVLIDFWAEWCAPCRMMSPILDEIAEEFQGKVTVAKINTDENHETAVKFGIKGIPTLMLFKNGELIATKVGAATKSQLTSFLEPHLA